MWRFYEWRIDHHAWLVILAGLTCLFACLVSGGLVVLARAGGRYRPRVVLSAAIVFAAGLWATLFILMLAFHPGIPIRDGVGATLVAVAAVLTVAWLGFAVALRRRGGGPDAWTSARLYDALSALGDVVSQSIWAARRGRGLLHGFAAAALLSVAICALDVIAIRGAPFAPETSIFDKSVSGRAAPDKRAPAKAASVGDTLTGAAWPGASNDLDRDQPPVRKVAMRMAQPPVPVKRAPAKRIAAAAMDLTLLVTEIATAQNIDPSLILAIIATESAFQPDAVSPGNAKGLMQLMPDTARRFGVSDLLDPAENIRAGTAYLRWLLAYFEGDISLALAAYNAGEGAVLRYGGVPPFPETRAYVQKIRTLYPAERHPFDRLALR